ncbi:hypothetical protein GQ43DRAFT_433304, partial [Delitschia confertaspora ATCC 74209]
MFTLGTNYLTINVPPCIPSLYGGSEPSPSSTLSASGDWAKGPGKLNAAAREFVPRQMSSGPEWVEDNMLADFGDATTNDSLHLVCPAPFIPCQTWSKPELVEVNKSAGLGDVMVNGGLHEDAQLLRDNNENDSAELSTRLNAFKLSNDGRLHEHAPVCFFDPKERIDIKQQDAANLQEQSNPDHRAMTGSYENAAPIEGLYGDNLLEQLNPAHHPMFQPLERTSPTDGSYSNDFHHQSQFSPEQSVQDVPYNDNFNPQAQFLPDQRFQGPYQPEQYQMREDQYGYNNGLDDQPPPPKGAFMPQDAIFLSPGNHPIYLATLQQHAPAYGVARYNNYNTIPFYDLVSYNPNNTIPSYESVSYNPHIANTIPAYSSFDPQILPLTTDTRSPQTTIKESDLHQLLSAAAGPLVLNLNLLTGPRLTGIHLIPTFLRDTLGPRLHDLTHLRIAILRTGEQINGQWCVLSINLEAFHPVKTFLRELVRLVGGGVSVVFGSKTLKDEKALQDYFWYIAPPTEALQLQHLGYYGGRAAYSVPLNYLVLQRMLETVDLRQEGSEEEALTPTSPKTAPIQDTEIRNVRNVEYHAYYAQFANSYPHPLAERGFVHGTAGDMVFEGPYCPAGEQKGGGRKEPGKKWRGNERWYSSNTRGRAGNGGRRRTESTIRGRGGKGSGKSGSSFACSVSASLRLAGMIRDPF